MFLKIYFICSICPPAVGQARLTAGRWVSFEVITDLG